MELEFKIGAKIKFTVEGEIDSTFYHEDGTIQLLYVRTPYGKLMVRPEAITWKSK